MTAVLTKGERSRGKLVTATAALLRRQGYHATGLSEIVAESGAPRGSLYFYFPGGKDELACAALDASGIEWRRRIAAVVESAADLGAAIDAIVTLLADDLEASGYQHGCPAAAVALEAISEPVRATVAAHYAAWEAAIAERLVSFGIAAPLANQLATVALASIEGALLLAKVSRSRAPLTAVAAALRAMVTDDDGSIFGPRSPRAARNKDRKHLGRREPRRATMMQPPRPTRRRDLRRAGRTRASAAARGRS